MSSSPNKLLPEQKKKWKDKNREHHEQRKRYKKEAAVKKLEKVLKDKKDQETREIEQARVKKPLSTISIAVPGSILDNAQSIELRTYLAGQIARAACIFKVDEVIIFDDYGAAGPKNSKVAKYESDGDERNISHCCVQLARILQYLECPQYLRKFFFPLHKDLKFSGLLNPLDAPHHLRQYNEFQFREGVVTNKPVKDGREGSYVNIGLLNDCFVDKSLQPGLRVTVKLLPNQDLKSRKLKGTVVAPSQPKLETGIYWGYNVRIAETLSKVFSKSPYEGGYDTTIGTSDKGVSVHTVESSSIDYNHLLIVFGGLQGLDGALETDEDLNVDDPSLLFDHYLNVVPGQGSRTIRTEEAILIALSSLEEKIKPLETVEVFDFAKLIPQSDETGVKQFEELNRKKPTTNKNQIDLSKFD